MVNISVEPPMNVTYLDDEVVIGTTHHYMVRAYTKVGEGLASDVITGMSYWTPGIPTSFTVSPHPLKSNPTMERSPSSGKLQRTTGHRPSLVTSS
jgi:hypothetical protein